MRKVCCRLNPWCFHAVTGLAPVFNRDDGLMTVMAQCGLQSSIAD